MLLLQRGCQIFVVESQRTFGSPCATGIYCIAIGFVLIQDLCDGQPLLSIKVDEAAKHIGIALQIAWILNEVVLCCQTTWEHTVAFTHQLLFVRLDGDIVKQIVLLLRLCVVRTALYTVVLINLHPCGRTPRTHKQLQLRTVLLCSTSQRNNVPLVALDVEVLQS